MSQYNLFVPKMLDYFIWNKYNIIVAKIIIIILSQR